MKKILSSYDIKFEMGFAESEQIANFLNEKTQETKSLSFIGRSNVGKSSLINALFKAKLAHVSNTPGRTREINLFSFWINEQKFFFFDLPGYGFAKASKQMQKNWKLLMGAFFEYLPLNHLVINIQDARHPFQKSDEEFMSFIKHFQLEAYLIFNKMDKLKTQKDRAKLANSKKDIFAKAKWVKQIHFISAETRQGLEELELSLKSYLVS